MNIYAEKEFLLRHVDSELLRKMIDCSYDFFYTELDELKENSLFITLGGFLFEPSEDFKVKLQNIKNKSLLIIHHGKSLSINSTATLNSFKNFIDEYKFDHNKVYLVTQLKYDIDSVLKAMPNINVLSYDRWLFEFFNYTVINNSFIIKEHIKTENFLPQKKFSILCKRYEPERLKIFCHLLINNLLDDFNYTFVADMFMYNDPILISNDVPTEFDMHKDKINQWIAGIPYQPTKQIEWQQHYHYPLELQYYFLTSHIHVSLETEPNNSSFLTEKTYRAIFYKKPFILISQHNALKALREEGYKTFSPYIDESYDEIADYETRLQAVIMEIGRLNKLPLAELEKIEKECKEIVEHNYKMLYENAFAPIPSSFKFKNMLSF